MDATILANLLQTRNDKLINFSPVNPLTPWLADVALHLVRDLTIFCRA